MAVGKTTDDEVTLGEVARNLIKLADEMQRNFDRVDSRFDNLAMVHSDVYLADRAADSDRNKDLVRRVSALESRNEWIVRTIAGIICSGAVGAIIAAVRIH